MPESNKDAIRGTGNRLVPKPIIIALPLTANAGERIDGE